jgi:excisionase family DNA binding protein
VLPVAKLAHPPLKSSTATFCQRKATALLEDTRERQEAPGSTREHPETRNDKETGRAPAAWLTPAEAVEESGIGRTRLYGFLTSGALPSAKIGRTRHIRRRDLDSFLEERITETTAASTK